MKSKEAKKEENQTEYGMCRLTCTESRLGYSDYASERLLLDP